MELTPLEEAVLRKLTKGEHSFMRTLRSQVEACSVREREMTGVGFWTELAVPSSVPRLENVTGNFWFVDVAAEIEGLDHGAGFVLWVEGGVAKCLEAYCYDESWPETVKNFTLSYMKKEDGHVTCITNEERDWATLEKEIGIEFK